MHLSASRVDALVALQAALEARNHPTNPLLLGSSPLVAEDSGSGINRTNPRVLNVMHLPLPGVATESDAASVDLCTPLSADDCSMATLARRLALCLLAAEREALSALVRGPMQRLLRSQAFEVWAASAAAELARMTG